MTPTLVINDSQYLNLNCRFILILRFVSFTAKNISKCPQTMESFQNVFPILEFTQSFFKMTLANISHCVRTLVNCFSLIFVYNDRTSGFPFVCVTV